MAVRADRHATLRALLLLGLLLNLGLLYLYYTPAPKGLQGDEHYYLGAATRLALGEPAALSAHWPPLYPKLMGHLFALCGPWRLPVQVVQIVMWLATAVMIHRLVLALGPDPRAADLSAGLFLLSPELMAFTHFLWAEIAHVFFFVAALWLMVCHARSLVAVAASGILLGLALLTKLLLLPIAPLLPLALYTPMSVRARLGRGLMLAAMMAATITPTMLANHARHGRFMIADSSGLALWLGLNPTVNQARAMREFLAASADTQERNTLYRQRALARIQEQGLVSTIQPQLARQYFLLLSYETSFTQQLPGGRSQMKGRYQFASPALAALLHLWAHVTHALLLALAALGAAAARPRSGGWWTVLLGFLLYNVLLYLVVLANPRYFVQMIPVAMLLAGVGAFWVMGLARGRPPASTAAFAFTGRRFAFGVALAVLLELVAFRQAPTFGL